MLLKFMSLFRLIDASSYITVYVLSQLTRVSFFGILSIFHSSLLQFEHSLGTKTTIHVNLPMNSFWFVFYPSGHAYLTLALLGNTSFDNPNFNPQGWSGWKTWDRNLWFTVLDILQKMENRDNGVVWQILEVYNMSISPLFKTVNLQGMF